MEQFWSDVGLLRNNPLEYNPWSTFGVLLYVYLIRSTWSCYWLDQFLTLTLNILILSIFYISMDLSTNYFAHFSGCWASFVCSCHSILECCVTFSGVKLSIRSFVLLLLLLLDYLRWLIFIKLYWVHIRYRDF